VTTKKGTPRPPVNGSEHYLARGSLSSFRRTTPTSCRMAARQRDKEEKEENMNWTFDHIPYNEPGAETQASNEAQERLWKLSEEELMAEGNFASDSDNAREFNQKAQQGHWGP
jgi:hypothetical protein